jgi:misacylated tRNA(Ala) deacylase
MAGSGSIEEIASKDAYTTEAEGSVLEVVEGGLLLDRTVFYARGGGQPGDIGVIRWDGGEVEVIDTVRREGKPFHVVPEGSVLPDPGTPVHGVIDWARRYRTMRTHTALHALSGVVFRDFGALVTGGNMEPGEARMDFNLPEVPPDFKARLEDLVNAEVAADRRIDVRVLGRDEALALPDIIRTQSNLIPADEQEIRIVDIVGLDQQADGGTHVASTAQIGKLQVVKVESKGKANRRVRVRLA